MISKTYGSLRAALTAEGAFRVSNLYGTLTVLTEGAIFTTGCVLLAAGSAFGPLYWIAQAVLATSMYRMFVVLHECGHKTLFRKKWVNTVVGTIVSPFCLLPYIPWRNIHFMHHKWVGVIDKDPTQAHLLKLHRLTMAEKFLFRVFWKCFLPIPFLKFLIDVFWLYPVREFTRGNRANGWKGTASVASCALPHLMLLAWMGPMGYLTKFGPALLGFYVIFELVNLPQHSGMFPHLSDDHPSSIPLRDQDEITRSTRLPRFLAVLLSYNFNLHTEHHLFPTVPWYSLPKVRNRIMEIDECVYHEVGLIEFAVDLRGKDPIEVYVNALPVSRAQREEATNPVMPEPVA